MPEIDAKVLEALTSVRDECLGVDGIRREDRSLIACNFEDARTNLLGIYGKGFYVNLDLSANEELYGADLDGYRYLYNHFLNHVIRMRKLAGLVEDF